MNHNNLYSLKDIELLKNKLDTYKQILESVKEGEVVNDYLFTKKENQEIKRQVKNLEEVIKKIKETQTSQLSQYEEQNKKNSARFQDANDFLKHLQQELTDLKNTINIRSVTQLDDKLNTLIELQQILISASEQDNNKVNIKKEETLPEHHVNNLSYQNSNLLPSSYKKLQNLLQTSNQTHFPSDQKRTLTGSNDVNVNQLNHHIKQNSPQNIPSTSGLNSIFSNSVPGPGIGKSKINPMRRNAKPEKNQNQLDIFKNNMNKLAMNNTKIPNLQNNIPEDIDQTQDTKGKLKQQNPIENEQSDQTQD
ncbi:hypothetical protein ABEY24_08915 [Peribacillus frigoritolerans]|uniref:hypothetical protein n=1 Tax=Peribacillus frigoritolerans TaxID=450367 RepID=UPI003D274AD2